MSAAPEIERRPVRTASAKQSIWSGLSEDTFRRNVVKLGKACNGVGWQTDIVAGSTEPIVPRGIVPLRGESDAAEYRLPREVEARLSNAIAVIAATQEGVHSVAAACVEESTAGDVLTLRLAANAGIPDGIRAALEEICEVVQSSAGTCEVCLMIGIFSMLNDTSNHVEGGARCHPAEDCAPGPGTDLWPG